MIVFFRGGWCLCCKIALPTYQAELARQLGILTAPSDGARAAQLQLGLDLTQVNADETTGLPMPTVMIADAAGTIRWIDVHRDYTCRQSMEWPPPRARRHLVGAPGGRQR